MHKLSSDLVWPPQHCLRYCVPVYVNYHCGVAFFTSMCDPSGFHKNAVLATEILFQGYWYAPHKPCFFSHLFSTFRFFHPCWESSVDTVSFFACWRPTDILWNSKHSLDKCLRVGTHALIPSTYTSFCNMADTHLPVLTVVLRCNIPSFTTG